MLYIQVKEAPIINSIEFSENLSLKIDDLKNELDNLYMLLWRVVNNIDGKRDIYNTTFLGVDATTKDEKNDNYQREWPKDCDCTVSVIKDLKTRGLLDIDDEFIKRWHIF